MKQKSGQINIQYAKVITAILENLKNSDNNYQQIFASTLRRYNQYPQDENILVKIQENKEARQLFEDHLTQFKCWLEGFRRAVHIHKKEKQAQNFDIKEKLVEILPKVKSKNLASSYLVQIIPIVKKELMFEDTFAKTWKAEKDVLRENILKQKASKAKNKVGNQGEATPEQRPQIKESIPQQRPPPPPLPARQYQPAPQRTIPPQRTSPEIRIERFERPERQRRQQQPQRSQYSQNLQNTSDLQRKRQTDPEKEKQRVKQANEAKIRKSKELRVFNLMKYLESRKQFSFNPNKEAIAREILHNLNIFMKNKIACILENSKLRVPGYDSEVAGDEFRYYSSKSNAIKIKHSVMLPQIDTKILRVKYPSKLEKYLKLRIQQQKQEQKCKNQLKQKLEGDKKVGDKIIQQYLIADQRQVAHEFQHDQGPKKRQRLIVPSQVIQFVIEQDPWFGDMYAMERTFYRSNG